MFGYGSGGYGGSYGGMGNSRNIGSDTSSKDPVMIRSRIFIGGLNTFLVSRDDLIDLFQNYGTILGVTVLKGFAFVQYSSPTEADMAVSALNMYNWNGNVLDVKIQTPHLVEASAARKAEKNAAIAAGQTSYPSGANAGGGQSFVKRPATDDVTAKKGRFTTTEIRAEVPDYFVCGNCHFTTNGLQAFAEHRQNPCDRVSATKYADEPSKFGCSSCDAEFLCSWELIEHHNQNHAFTVFKDISAEAQ